MVEASAGGAVAGAAGKLAEASWGSAGGEASVDVGVGREGSGVIKHPKGMPSSRAKCFSFSACVQSIIVDSALHLSNLMAKL